MNDTKEVQNNNRIKLVLRITEILVLSILLLIVVAPPLVRYTQKLFVSNEEKITQRDQQRIKDTALIQTAIMQYKIRNGFYPVSTQQAPFINTSASDAKIWIPNITEEFLPFVSDLNQQLTSLPKDPLNQDDFIYQYKSSKPPSNDYELNIRLENDTDNLAKQDQGNNDKLYEIGTDLELIN